MRFRLSPEGFDHLRFSVYVGKETARVVLEHNVKVYIACRSEERANAAIVDLKAVTGMNDIHFLSLDLASFASIRKSVEEFKRYGSSDSTSRSVSLTLRIY